METTLVTFEIETKNFKSFQVEFAKLAKKAAKLGVVAPSFEVTQADKIYPAEVTEFGQVRKPARRVNVVKVVGQAPKIAGWTFVATLQHEEKGNLVHRVPGTDHIKVEMDLRSAKAFCQHCKIARKRKDTYVVAHDDGVRQLQVGRNCLVDFLGHESPEAIARWAELLSSFQDKVNDGDFDGGGFGGGGSPVATLDEFIPYVVANIRVHGWMSRTKARDTNAQATADGAWVSLFPHTEFEKQNALKPEDADKVRAAKAVEYVRNYFEEHATDTLSDYEHNLRLIVEGLSVDGRAAGIAASLVVFAERAMGKEIEAQLRAKRAETAQYVGTVGKRQTFRVQVQKVVDIDGYYGVTHLHLLLDEQGNSLKWFASNDRLEVGSWYEGKATVKAHEEYEGLKQTALSRCSFEKIDVLTKK